METYFKISITFALIIGAILGFTWAVLQKRHYNTSIKCISQDGEVLWESRFKQEFYWMNVPKSPEDFSLGVYIVDGMKCKDYALGL